MKVSWGGKDARRASAWRAFPFQVRDDCVAPAIIASDSCTVDRARRRAYRHEAPVTAMPDLRVTAPDRVVEGDRLAVLFVGRSKGPAAAAKWCSPIC